MATKPKTDGEPGAKPKARLSQAESRALKAKRAIANKAAYAAEKKAAQEATKARTAARKVAKPTPGVKHGNEGRRTSTGVLAAGPDDPKYTPLTPLVLESFLHALALTGNLTEVCDELRVNRIAVLKQRREDSEFAKRYSLAMEDAVEGWEAEVARRAFQGVLEPVFQQGECVGHIRKYSDRLAEMMVRGGKPAQYSARTVGTVELSGTVGVKHASLTNEELNKEINAKAASLGMIAASRAEYLKLMGRPPEDEGAVV